MDFKPISLKIEEELEVIFAELKSGISAREDSRAFGAMIEKHITDNWKDICDRNGFEHVDIPGRRSIFDFASRINGQLYGFDV